MGLKITLPHPKHYFGHQDVDEIDIILHTKEGGEGSLEIVGFDMEVAEAAEALGLDDYDAELFLYQHYKKQGLYWMLERHPAELYAAFEAQGYDVFDDEQYDASEFLNAIGQYIRDLEGPTEENIELLAEAVEDEAYEKGEFIDDLVEGLATFADPDRDRHWSDEGHEGLYLHHLVKLLPEKAFVFKPDGKPVDDYYEANERTWFVPFAISINDTEIISWNVQVVYRITDPITFDLDEIDPCSEYDNPETYCPPPSAVQIMDYMGWRYPPLPDLPGPGAPESDPDGLFGVEYLKPLLEYTRFGDSTNVTGIPTGEVKRTLVRYETLNEAQEAADLSDTLINNYGMMDKHTINVVAFDEQIEEWIEV